MSHIYMQRPPLIYVKRPSPIYAKTIPRMQRPTLVCKDQPSYAKTNPRMQRPTLVCKDQPTYAKTNPRMQRPTLVCKDQPTYAKTNPRMQRPTHVCKDQPSYAKTNPRMQRPTLVCKDQPSYAKTNPRMLYTSKKADVFIIYKSRCILSHKTYKCYILPRKQMYFITKVWLAHSLKPHSKNLQQLHLYHNINIILIMLYQWLSVCLHEEYNQPYWHNTAWSM